MEVNQDPWNNPEQLDITQPSIEIASNFLAVIDGYAQLTQDYIDFKPLNSPELDGNSFSNFAREYLLGNAARLESECFIKNRTLAYEAKLLTVIGDIFKQTKNLSLEQITKCIGNSELIEPARGLYVLRSSPQLFKLMKLRNVIEGFTGAFQNRSPLARYIVVNKETENIDYFRHEIQHFFDRSYEAQRYKGIGKLRTELASVMCESNYENSFNNLFFNHFENYFKNETENDKRKIMVLVELIGTFIDQELPCTQESVLSFALNSYDYNTFIKNLLGAINFDKIPFFESSDRKSVV